jgi:hypothetical protein
MTAFDREKDKKSERGTQENTTSMMYVLLRKCAGFYYMKFCEAVSFFSCSQLHPLGTFCSVTTPTFGSMYYVVSDVHEEDLESNYHKSGCSDDDDETAAAGLVADFSHWADDISEIDSPNKKTGYPPDFGVISFVSSDNLSLRVKALPDANPTLATECMKTELKRPTAKSCAELNQSQGKGSMRESVSVSAWTMQDQDTSPPPKSARISWKEISAEINRFAEENMRNAGWDDLWAYKKKAGEVDESLSFLSTQSLQAIRKAVTAFQDSFESQQKLEEWDKMMGLKRCHSRTMAKSLVTRKKLLESLGALKLQKEMIKPNEGRVN